MLDNINPGGLYAARVKLLGRWPTDNIYTLYQKLQSLSSFHHAPLQDIVVGSSEEGVMKVMQLQLIMLLLAGATGSGQRLLHLRVHHRWGWRTFRTRYMATRAAFTSCSGCAQQCSRSAPPAGASCSTCWIFTAGAFNALTILSILKASLDGLPFSPTMCTSVGHSQSSRPHRSPSPAFQGSFGRVEGAVCCSFLGLGFVCT